MEKRRGPGPSPTATTHSSWDREEAMAPARASGSSCGS